MTHGQVLESVLERPKPHSPEAERAILGAILLDSIMVFIAREMLRPDDFYVLAHRRIYQAMLTLLDQKQTIDPVMISNEIQKGGVAGETASVSFITNLTFGLPHSTNIDHYAKVLRGKSMLRQMIDAHVEGLGECYAEEDEPEIVYDHSERRFRDLATEANVLRPAMRDYSEVGASVLRMFDAWSAGKIVAIPTQIPEVDSRLVNSGHLFFATSFAQGVLNELHVVHDH